MTEREMLTELLERSRQHLFELSANWLMTKPKDGCAIKHERERDIIEYLEMLLESAE